MLSCEILMKFQGNYEKFVNFMKINRTILKNTYKYEKNFLISE